MDLTQIYFSLVVGNKKTKIFADTSDKGAGLFVSLVFDLIELKMIDIDEKGRIYSHILQVSKVSSHLLPIFSVINKRDLIKPERLVGDFLLEFQNDLAPLFKNIGDGLVSEGKAHRQIRYNFTGSRLAYQIDGEYLASAIETLKKLPQKACTQRELVLLLLLEEAKVLKRYLSRSEIKKIKLLLRQFEEEAGGKLAKKMLIEHKNIVELNQVKVI